MPQRLFLIDGHGYIYRAFFALPHLSTSKGLPTNAVYGFTAMLLKVVREHQPDYLAVAFDSKGPTQRHTDFEAYKAHRRPMPDHMASQLPYIQRMVEAFAIPTLMIEGFEADDLIGTIVRQAEAQGLEVTIVTADKDMLQLVSPHVRVYDTLKDKVYGEAEVRERFGVGPELVADVLGLMGDATDNIPGVPGIGEKTATKLVAEFGGVERILADLDQVRQPKLRASLVQHADQARLSRRLATIQTDCPVKLDLDAFQRHDPDLVRLTALCRELEFTALLNTLAPSSQTASLAYDVVDDPHTFARVIERARETGAITLTPAWTAGRPAEAELRALAYATAAGALGIVVPPGARESLAQDPLPDETIRHLAALLADEHVTVRGHNVKPLITWAFRKGFTVRARLRDTMLAAYLLNPNRPDQSLAPVALEYLSRPIATPDDHPAVYADWCQAADALVDDLHARVAADGQTDVLDHIEIPLIPVLAQMESLGIRVDADLLSALSKELDAQMTGMMQRLYALAGGEFNLNSPKQLADILFNRLGLTPIKKTKTGYSTDEGVLTQLAAQHELPAEILAYRQIAKLKSTYVDALPLLISPRTGRVHTTYHQAVAATGRLSSSDPNLQNIPIKGPMGPRIRAAFVADPGYVLVSADYSQIELRILAHLSQDERLIEAFASDGDIHTDTARTIFNLPAGEITPAMRRAAKTVNFGIIYGISAFGLADQLGVSQTEAKRYIDEYFAHYQGVKRFVEATIAKAHAEGVVTTLLGRKRPIPELSGATTALRSFGERSAVNSPIQGSAADLIKLAMVKIHHRLAREQIDARMLLQVHDELVFEVSPKGLEPLKALVKAEMEGAFPLSVPMRVDIGAGPTWADAH
ncbi:MAG: DNA polymerase I [Nitrospirae bacterium]|nr:DNA polymerase I [Nitrospirota bacterium]